MPTSYNFICNLPIISLTTDSNKCSHDRGILSFIPVCLLNLWGGAVNRPTQASTCTDTGLVRNHLKKTLIVPVSQIRVYLFKKVNAVKGHFHWFISIKLLRLETIYKLNKTSEGIWSTLHPAGSELATVLSNSSFKLTSDWVSSDSCCSLKKHAD